MTNPAWKQEERKVARALGGERNPLSGSNSRHTAGDVIQTPHYVDAKLSGSQNDSGERYYTLQRADVYEVQEQATEEEKDLGLMTVRFKHCSDRYVIIPIDAWASLLPGEMDTWNREKALDMRAQGNVTHRLYRKTLQKLDNIWLEDAGAPVIFHQWAESDHGPEEAIITWESFLYLDDRLKVCPEGCGWKAMDNGQPHECSDCGSLLEGISHA